MDEVKKVPHWGQDVPIETDDQDIDEDAVKEMAENDLAWHMMWKSVASSLYLIYTELKRVNDYIIEGEATPSMKIEEAPPTPQPTEPMITAIPANLKSEDEIIGFYKQQLSDLMNKETLDGVEITVEKDKVVLKLPWLERGWAAINDRLVDGLGANRVVDGRNTHYVLPHP